MHDIFMKVAVSLRVKSQELTAGAIVSALNLTPTRSWTKGEARSSPRGQPLEGVWHESYATFTLIDGERMWLTHALSSCERQLTGKAPILATMKEGGASIELFVGWFLDRNGGDTLPAGLLVALGNLGLDLSLDVYPFEQATCSRSGQST